MNKTKTVYLKQANRYGKTDIPEKFADYKEWWNSLTDDEQLAAPEPTEITRNEYLVATAPDFQPFDNQVLVVPEPQPEKTRSGIYTPNIDKDEVKTHWGIVVKLGTNPEDKVMEAQPGDYVAYSRFAGTEIELEIGGEKYRLIRSTDIHGRVPGKSLAPDVFEVDHVTLPDGCKVPVQSLPDTPGMGKIVAHSADVYDSLYALDRLTNTNVAAQYKHSVTGVINGKACVLRGFWIKQDMLKAMGFNCHWDTVEYL